MNSGGRHCVVEGMAKNLLESHTFNMVVSIVRRWQFANQVEMSRNTQTLTNDFYSLFHERSSTNANSEHEYQIKEAFVRWLHARHNRFFYGFIERSLLITWIALNERLNFIIFFSIEILIFVSFSGTRHTRWFLFWFVKWNLRFVSFVTIRRTCRAISILNRHHHKVNSFSMARNQTQTECRFVFCNHRWALR